MFKIKTKLQLLATAPKVTCIQILMQTSKFHDLQVARRGGGGGTSVHFLFVCLFVCVDQA